MTQDVDLHHLIEMLDAALTSKDPTVQKALKKFLFIAALAMDNEEHTPGPIESILQDLQRRLAALESKNATYGHPDEWKKTWVTPQYPYTTWTTGTAIGGPLSNGTITTTSAGTGSVSSNYITMMKDAYKELSDLKKQYIAVKTESN
jgi:hypothetical protein